VGGNEWAVVSAEVRALFSGTLTSYPNQYERKLGGKNNDHGDLSNIAFFGVTSEGENVKKSFCKTCEIRAIKA